MLLLGRQAVNRCQGIAELEVVDLHAVIEVDALLGEREEGVAFPVLAVFEGLLELLALFTDYREFGYAGLLEGLEGFAPLPDSVIPEDQPITPEDLLKTVVDAVHDEIWHSFHEGLPCLSLDLTAHPET